MNLKALKYYSRDEVQQALLQISKKREIVGVYENGKFDMRWFPWPKPKEGSGVSNNHRRKGKPKYDKAKFTVGQEAEPLSIEMVY